MQRNGLDVTVCSVSAATRRQRLTPGLSDSGTFNQFGNRLVAHHVTDLIDSQSAEKTGLKARSTTESSASRIILSGPPVGSLALRPGDSLTILTMALSVSFTGFVSSTSVTQATGR
jgi:hypothetical protein